MNNFEEEFELLLKCKTPLIQVVTHEWQRLQSLVSIVSTKLMTKWKRWNSSIGLIDSDGNVENITDPIMILKRFKNENESRFLILENFNFFLQSPQVVDNLFEIVKMKKVFNKTLIIESSELSLPNALAKEMVVLHMPLPNKKFIKKIAESAAISTDLDASKYDLTDELMS